MRASTQAAANLDLFAVQGNLRRALPVLVLPLIHVADGLRPHIAQLPQYAGMAMLSADKCSALKCLAPAFSSC